jgi:hypothetical protein
MKTYWGVEEEEEEEEEEVVMDEFCDTK